MPYPSRLLRGIAPIACGALLSCGGGSDDAGLFSNGNGSNGTVGGSDAGLMLSLGNSDASLGLSVDGAPTGLVGGGSLDDAACAMNSRKADQVPLDMYLMLDSSGSMTDFIADGKTTKWDGGSESARRFRERSRFGRARCWAPILSTHPAGSPRGLLCDQRVRNRGTIRTL